MITEITLTNWKSYQQATLYVDPLTILIGTNSGGKSNLIEAIKFLQLSTSGLPLSEITNGSSTLDGIRGGAEMLAYRGDNSKTISLSVKVVPKGEVDIHYIYSMSFMVNESGEVRVVNENLQKYLSTENQKEGVGKQNSVNLFNALPAIESLEIPDEYLTLSVNVREGYTELHKISSSKSALSQFTFNKAAVDTITGLNTVREVLNNIFVLSPDISKMRTYSRVSEDLSNDASNIAGVIASFKGEQGEDISRILTNYIDRLSEKDISRVWAEVAGHFQKDAMLYIEERWHDDQKFIVDARAASDGTLHLLSVMTALLTLKKGTLLIIEDIDEGLHSSRSDLLVEFLKEVSIKRGVDVLMTTHNASLLDAFGNEMIAFMSRIHRDEESGASKITLLEDLKQLPRLLAKGKVGKISTMGLLDKAS
jgi:predicted ATPase